MTTTVVPGLTLTFCPTCDGRRVTTYDAETDAVHVRLVDPDFDYCSDCTTHAQDRFSQYALEQFGPRRELDRQPSPSQAPDAKKAPTPEEFVQLLRMAAEGPIDVGKKHVQMDLVLCETLESLGYGEGVKLFHSTPKFHG